MLRVLSTSKIFLFGLSSAWLAACSSEPTCDYSKAPYMSASSVASLQAPEGLTAPDRSASLTIPPAPETNSAPLGKGKCLDRPPSYFSTAPRTGTPSKEKAPEK
jgi:uncharacterized lipoprotein